MVDIDYQCINDLLNILLYSKRSVYYDRIRDDLLTLDL